MKLAYWMYAGPAHIGTLRVATSFHNVHAIMHAPLGDDYFNVMRSMLEREKEFTPVTTSVVDRHVLARGSQEKVVENITRKDKEEKPDLILLTPTCTSSILQEDLHNFAQRASMESTCDVLLADVNHYRVNELQAADRTLEQIVRFYTESQISEFLSHTQENPHPLRTSKPSANLIGFFTLGFHNSHDCKELIRLFDCLGVEVNLVLPDASNTKEGTRVTELHKLPQAWFNVVPYREVGLMTAQYLEKNFHMPFISLTPMGVCETKAFIQEVQSLLNKMTGKVAETTQIQNLLDSGSHASWFARSIDCQNLTGKRACVFGDATHAVAMTKILVREMGIHVLCVGTYCKHDADWFREQIENAAGGLADEILITDDHTEVADMIVRLAPDAIFGTQMERHIGKRLGIPCGVISAPVHIQNFPCSAKPFLGIEGTNQIADLIYNSFTLGMEDHLLEIFGGHDSFHSKQNSEPTNKNLDEFNGEWATDAEAALHTIPAFVRNKVKTNTEKFAIEQNSKQITLELFYRAKEAIK
jgi:light-independent protochlorophyllide reductase subunit B